MPVHELRPTGGNGASSEGAGDELWDRREQQLTSEENPPQSSRAPQGLWASVWPRVLAVLVVTSVGLPAAVASYWHLQEVAARFNPGSALAYWLPLSVDGLLAAALVVVWSRRTRGERVGFGPWAAFAFGMIVTLLANAASVVPESEWARGGSVLAAVAAWTVALFPPVAFAVSLELIAIVLRPARAAAGRPDAAGLAHWTDLHVSQAQAEAVAECVAPAASQLASDQSPVLATRPVRAEDASDDDQADTAPLPVVTPPPGRGEDMSKVAGDAAAALGAGTSGTASVGATKLARAEALLAAAWARGEDLSLAEVDRIVAGNRTAAKAKRRLRDRGLTAPCPTADARSDQPRVRMVPA